MGLLAQLHSLPNLQQKRIVQELSEDDILNILYDWENEFARPEQLLPDGNWIHWLILAGRYFGKTRTGAQLVNYWANEYPGCRIALVAETTADARDVMVQGESGILECAHPKLRPVYEPTNRLVEWSNGSRAFTYSNEKPGQMRGPQHHFGWLDELAKFSNQVEVWDMFEMSLRLSINGSVPRSIITTTPRPTKLIKELYSDNYNATTRSPAQIDGDVYITTGYTYDNPNAPPSFVKRLKKKYEGTRIGRQELYAEILEDNPNALFTSDDIESRRVSATNKEDLFKTMDRIVVALDPAASMSKTSDEHGIVVCGRRGDEGYVFQDATESPATVNQACANTVGVYKRFKANLVVAEANNGGDWIESAIRNVDPLVKYKKVHATRGKVRRAEPIQMLYEQKRIIHVGFFPSLEEQMVGFDPNIPEDQQNSPDRMDALVWAFTELFGDEQHEGYGVIPISF